MIAARVSFRMGLSPFDGTRPELTPSGQAQFIPDGGGDRCAGDPGRARTCDLLLRSQMVYKLNQDLNCKLRDFAGLGSQWVTSGM